MNNNQLVNERGGRDLYYDSLKFLLITLVVIAHVFEPVKYESMVNQSVYNWINMFHMPLFIFISGRFSVIKDKKKYKIRIWRILETYMVFQFIWMMLELLCHNQVGVIDWLTPYYVMWYLLSLVLWRIMLYLIVDRIKETPIIWILVSIVISLLGGYIPIGPLFSFQRTLAFFPFFVAGYCTRRYDIKYFANRLSSVTAIFILAISFVIITQIEGKIQMTYIFCCAFPYSWYSGNILWPMLLARALFIVMAIIMSLAILRLVPDNEKCAQWGARTLFVFIYHAFVTYALFTLFGKGVIPNTLPWLLLYSAIIITMMLTMSQWKFLSWLLNPISSKIRK